MKRREALFGTVSIPFLVGLGRANPPESGLLPSVAGPPSFASAFTENGAIVLHRNGERWLGNGIEVGTAEQAGGVRVTLRSPKEAVVRIHLRWEQAIPVDWKFLGDDWERSYGDLAWRGMNPERVMPWYFLTFDGKSTAGCGVKTGAGALCFWQADPAGVSLWLDVRNGGRGVQLGGREAALAQVVAESYAETKPFAAAKRFCRRLCEHPRLPAAPVYGGNNWYYAYGKSSAEDIRADSGRIAQWAGSNENRPFMVIDDGWAPNATAGPWAQGNAGFPDMAGLATQMGRIGVQPGLWIRPLFTKEEIPAGWRLTSPNSAREYAARQAYTIDPTVPDALAKVQEDVHRAVEWGYGLIKHDFSTYDLLGRWGFRMGAEVTDANWNFADRSRTNAEVIRDFYKALRKGAGSALLLGCNTVGHLSAGLFELQRIGDDTSGRDWNRTLKMGVNTLAFRMAQQGSFFAIDADCVGLTRQIPWKFNRQWLDLLARSGTPLFVSAAPDAVGPEQAAALRNSFAVASKPSSLGEPMDWLLTTQPQKWVLRGEEKSYSWYGAEGVDPFAT